ncbi:hypothetical protein C1N27_01095 [Vibrio diazotrophicus]|nr:hypothetical protein C1N27_01095 [Vibrio diazotrophicus]
MREWLHTATKIVRSMVICYGDIIISESLNGYKLLIGTGYNCDIYRSFGGYSWYESDLIHIWLLSELI